MRAVLPIQPIIILDSAVVVPQPLVGTVVEAEAVLDKSDSTALAMVSENKKLPEMAAAVLFHQSLEHHYIGRAVAVAELYPPCREMEDRAVEVPEVMVLAFWDLPVLMDTLLEQSMEVRILAVAVEVAEEEQAVPELLLFLFPQCTLYNQKHYRNENEYHGQILFPCKFDFCGEKIQNKIRNQLKGVN
jgi:hypothetical protein